MKLGVIENFWFKPKQSWHLYFFGPPRLGRSVAYIQRAIPACWPDVSKNQLWLDEAKAAIVANMQRINLYLWGIMEEKMSIFCTPLSIWFLLTCEKR